jgi:surface protein
MDSMFYYASSFNKDISSWNVSLVSNHNNFRTWASAWVLWWPTGW